MSVEKMALSKYYDHLNGYLDAQKPTPWSMVQQVKCLLPLKASNEAIINVVHRRGRRIQWRDVTYHRNRSTNAPTQQQAVEYEAEHVEDAPIVVECEPHPPRPITRRNTRRNRSRAQVTTEPATAAIATPTAGNEDATPAARERDLDPADVQF